MSLILSAGICKNNLDNVGELLLENSHDEPSRLALTHLNSWLSALTLFFLCQISQVPVLFPLPGEIVFKEEAHEGEEPVECLALGVVDLDDGHLVMYLVAHLVGDDGRRLLVVEEELEQLVDDLVVEFDGAGHGPLELPQEQLQQLVGLDTHLTLIVVRGLAVYVD